MNSQTPKTTIRTAALAVTVILFMFLLFISYDRGRIDELEAWRQSVDALLANERGTLNYDTGVTTSSIDGHTSLAATPSVRAPEKD